jgi:hypothetical protein
MLPLNHLSSSFRRALIPMCVYRLMPSLAGPLNGAVGHSSIPAPPARVPQGNTTFELASADQLAALPSPTLLAVVALASNAALNITALAATDLGGMFL